ncbi:MAG: class I SAM-dependent methyltransferase [Firmicutes bacterium]|nr:class I SAM-dependent methyltransferase [Bacillota bacterium]
MEKLKDFLMKNGNAKILDIGTGNGNFIRIIAGLTNDFQEITGIDVLEGAIAAAQKSFEDERIKFIKMDALNMTFDDHTFDIVCLSNSLHHLEDISSSIQEMERVLKPGGFLVFSEMVSNDLSPKQMSHLLMHHFAAEIDRAKGSFHDETYSNTKIIETLKSHSNLSVFDSWNLEYPQNEELSKEDMDWLMTTIDRMLSRMEQTDEYVYFQKKADDVKNYIRENGLESATQLMVILQ